MHQRQQRSASRLSPPQRRTFIPRWRIPPLFLAVFISLSNLLTFSPPSHTHSALILELLLWNYNSFYGYYLIGFDLTHNINTHTHTHWLRLSRWARGGNNHTDTAWEEAPKPTTAICPCHEDPEVYNRCPSVPVWKSLNVMQILLSNIPKGLEKRCPSSS